MVVMVLVRERLRVEDEGVKLLIQGESRLGIFQVPFRDPRIFFGRIPFPSDQEGTGRRSSVVAYDFFNFVFLFSINKVRRWYREVLTVDLVFSIGR